VLTDLLPPLKDEIASLSSHAEQNYEINPSDEEQRIMAEELHNVKDVFSGINVFN
jgi:hypothetical protein